MLTFDKISETKLKTDSKHETKHHKKEPKKVELRN